MEIFFCFKCSARLSNTDIERGDAVVYEGEVYCYQCVPDGVDAESLPKPKRKGSSFNIPAVRGRARPGSRKRTRTPQGTGFSGARKKRPSSSRNRPSSATRGKPPSGTRTRPPSARLRPDAARGVSLSPKGVVLIAAVLGVAFAAAAFFAMRMLG